MSNPLVLLLLGFGVSLGNAQAEEPASSCEPDPLQRGCCLHALVQLQTDPPKSTDLFDALAIIKSVEATYRSMLGDEAGAQRIYDSGRSEDNNAEDVVDSDSSHLTSYSAIPTIVEMAKDRRPFTIEQELVPGDRPVAIKAFLREEWESHKDRAIPVDQFLLADSGDAVTLYLPPGPYYIRAETLSDPNIKIKEIVVRPDTP